MNDIKYINIRVRVPVKLNLAYERVLLKLGRDMGIGRAMQKNEHLLSVINEFVYGSVQLSGENAKKANTVPENIASSTRR